jgi:hypothetical protein
MARKIVNRRELRNQADAAAERGEAKPKKAAAKPKTPRKSRAKKKTGEVRLKAFWGVFNQSLKRVALYEYSDRKQADKKAAELNASGKSPHFVKPVKEAIEVVEEA